MEFGLTHKLLCECGDVHGNGIMGVCVVSVK